MQLALQLLAHAFALPAGVAALAEAVSRVLLRHAHERGLSPRCGG